MHTKPQVSIALFILLLFASCKQKNDNTTLLDVAKDQALLSTYFVAATVGVISASDELRYVLQEPLDADIADDLVQKIITLDPSAEGHVSISNNTVITFKPSTPLAPETTYTVKIDLRSINATKYPKILEYQIKTFKQEMLVETEGLFINDDGTISIMLGVKTADKVVLESLKSCFQSDANDISVIERSENDYEVEVQFAKGMKKTSFIRYDGKNIGCSSQGDVPLFDINTKEFGVIYTHSEATAKVFNIYFSQKLNKNQDLTGLLTVNGKNASYTIKNNLLTIFLGEERDENKVTISLATEIKSSEGKPLVSPYSYEISLDVDKPAVEFVSNGNYFPSEGDFKIPIKSKSLTELRVVVIEIKQENVTHYLAWQSLQYADFYNLRMYGKPVYDEIISLQSGIKDNEGWTVYGIDLSEKIRKNPGSIYHISLDYGPENTSLACKSGLKKYQVNSKIPEKEFFSKRDDYYDDYYFYYEDLNWEEREDPCKIAFYMAKEPTQKLFICSDYSIIAKKAGRNYHVALTKLMDLSTVADAQVSIYDLQSELMGLAKTSSQGFVQFSGLKYDASVLKIEKNNQITYLSLDPNQSNTFTEFDIEGERSEIETQFFTYSDRDVWRPGDSIYIDLMVNAKQAELPDGIPVVMSFYNTDNLLVDKQVQSLSLSSKQIYNFTLRTPPTAKTGLYRCIFQIGSATVRKNIRIETIKPNAAEVIYTFEDEVDNTIYSDHISGSIEAKYLTGFGINGAKIKAIGRGRKKENPFIDYRTYTFDVLDKEDVDKNMAILDLTTDEKGKSTFVGDQKLTSYNTPLTVSIETEMILPGGGTNKEGKSVSVSPFESYIGVSRNEGRGWNGNYTFDENLAIDIVNLNNRGKLNTKSNKVTYTLRKHINSWWVDKYMLRSSGNFVNSVYWEDVESSSLSIKGKGKINYPKGKLSKGAYKLTLEDAASGHRTQAYFTVYDGIESVPGSQPYILAFTTDKDEYKTGEDIVIKFPDVKDAKVLVSIERGNQVIEQVWYALDNKDNELHMATDQNWSPNVYINVTLIQKYKQDNNDLPLRMYGIKHIKMDGNLSQLKPICSIPDKLESNKTYTFTITESESRAMEYTYAIVDEGLLNLTGFKTPDPHKHFNGRFPLLVKTWDLYDYLIQYFKGKFAGIISIGGDDAYNPDAIAEVSRFKPVVIHQGSFKLGKGSTNTHTISIPNYIGKVRLMIVACSENNFGKLDKFIPVKNPLMVQSQFPRALNVSDKLQLPVTILRDDANIKTADLTVKADATYVKGFTASKSIAFGTKDQMSHIYNIEVQQKTGKFNVEMGIQGGGKSMKESTEILINYPNSYASTIAKNILEPSEKLDVLVNVKGYKDAFTSKIMISGLKVPNFTQYAEDLISYPYGCLEQTTSAGFAQLYLDKIILLDPKENRSRIENLQTTVNKISRFQMSSGKFSYWDGTYYHAWSDIYTGNYLIEMQRLGYLPQHSDILDKWVSAHQTTANNWSAAELINGYESEALAQAFRLFVLAKSGKPAKSAMNRFVTSCTAEYPITWWLMAGCFQLSGYDTKANECLKSAESLQINSNRSDYFGSFGDYGRDLAIVVEILSYFKNEKPRMENYYDKMVEILNESRWTSTQTKGFSFIAANKYFGSSLQIANKVDYTISGMNGVKTYQHSAVEPKIINIDPAYWAKNITIQNKGKGKLYVYRTDRFIDSDLIKGAESNNLGLDVSYYNNTQNRNGLDNVKIGDDISIKVNITNPSALVIEDLALNVKMPSGWELINPRLYETKVNNDAGLYNYQDFKDDRVYTFFSLKAGRSQTYLFKAKAAFTGDFYMPAISCEHMYNGNINAKSKTGRIVIGQ